MEVRVFIFVAVFMIILGNIFFMIILDVILFLTQFNFTLIHFSDTHAEDLSV